MDSLLDLGSAGQGIRMLAEPIPGLVPSYSVRIEVFAYPFSGTIETRLDADDLDATKSGIVAFEAGEAVRLLGGRAPLVQLEWFGTNVQVEVTSSEDDPQTFIRYLVFPPSPAS